jgi:glycosyltransferase involved in cell wall biosynthesis
MRILLITDGITPYVLGGMQKHSANLAKYLTLHGVKVTLVHCVGFKDKLPSNHELNNKLFNGSSELHDIIGLNFPNMGKVPGHYLKESYRYSELIFDKVKNKLNDYDFIYAKGFSAWKLMQMKLNGMKMPPIGVKFHGYEMYQKPPSVLARLQQVLLRKPVKWNNLHADFVFSYGAKITNLIEDLGVVNERIIEIPSGIDDEWVKKEVEKVGSPLKFVFLGRYERRKGIEELTGVLQSILKDYNFEFHFIGPIPDDKKIDSDKIIYHGVIQAKKKLTGLLDNIDVLVCPSHSEGMPNVILEGMARGLAIIATDVGAVKLLVSDNVGVLLKTMDVNELEEAILKMISLDENEVIYMKKQSLSLVSNEFTWDKIAKTTISKIKSIINE